MTALSDNSKLFTVFLPNNNAFRASAAITNNPALASIAGINAIPLSVLVPLIQYHIIPGQQYTSADIPTTFPNVQLPSYFTIATVPGTPIALNMSTFPSVRSNGFWDNNVPVVAPDMNFSNGVVHMVAGLVAPPSQLLRDAIYNNPDLTYFKAAIARADVGQTGLSKIDSLLNFAVTNMTVLAPSDEAFKTLIHGLAFQGYLDYLKSLGLTPNATDSANAMTTADGAVAAGPAFLSSNNVTTKQVQGIVGYHLLATPNPVSGDYEPNVRAFSVNFSSTPTFYTTLVNREYPPQVQPGVMAQATFTTLGPNISIVTNLKFTGAGTFPPGGAPYGGAAATATSMDNHCINGVYYVIDKVLLPQ
jgi:uncharacterized surface protein with fasciclin (FAS1) repeats